MNSENRTTISNNEYCRRSLPVCVSTAALLTRLLASAAATEIASPSSSAATDGALGPGGAKGRLLLGVRVRAAAFILSGASSPRRARAPPGESARLALSNARTRAPGTLVRARRLASPSRSAARHQEPAKCLPIDAATAGRRAAASRASPGRARRYSSRAPAQPARATRRAAVTTRGPRRARRGARPRRSPASCSSVRLAATSGGNTFVRPSAASCLAACVAAGLRWGGGPSALPVVVHFRRNRSARQDRALDGPRL